MRALVQRVSRASVRVEGEIVGAIGGGLLVLVGVTHADDASVADRLAGKVANLRIFDDDAGRMDRSLVESGGAALVVSQFTLYGDARKGRRPSWGEAAAPEHAEPLVAAFATALAGWGVTVATGRFRAHMAVELVNDGPVTLALEA
jgi:D-aminoacyl-tRNA deacylase